MKKTDILVIPPFGKIYASKATDEPLMQQLPLGGLAQFTQIQAQLEKLGTRTYAPGKWTVHQIIEHITDAERIFQYRALRFVRQDQTPLAGFDEDIYAALSRANDRTIGDLLQEFSTVRAATVSLFKNLDKDQLQFIGTANNQACSVLALGFMIIGHATHHAEVIKEKYLPLVQE